MNNACELSIEETNILREKLGLKKLEITQKPTETINNLNETKNEIKNETKDETKKETGSNIHQNDSQKNIKNNSTTNNAIDNANHNETEVTMITRSKRNVSSKNNTKIEEDTKNVPEKMATRSSKRIAEKTETVKPISESFNDDINDVDSWVKKTKNLINQKLEPKALYSDEENEKTEKDENKKQSKKGRKKKEIGVNKFHVEHKSEDVKEEMILTLKDTNILNENEEADCLINEELKTQNKKKLLHKSDGNYWNKNYYDPLSYYDENQKVETEGVFNMLPKYDDEKHFFEVEVNHEENEEEENIAGKKKIVETKREQDEVQKKTENEKKEKEELQNKLTGKKRGRKKKQPESELKDMLQNENQAGRTDCFIKLKKRKTQNIRKRKKEDKWGFLFDSGSENKQEEAKGGVEKEVEYKKRKNKETDKDMDKNMDNENDIDKEKEESKKKNKEGAKEKGKENEQENDDVADEIVKILLEDPSNLSFDLGFDRFGDVGEDAEEVYTLLEKVAELKKKKKENKQKNNLVKYVVINEGKKGNNEESVDKKGNTGDSEQVQNEIIKLTETSEFCKNILLTTDLCASDNEDTNHGTRKKGTRENSRKKKSADDGLRSTNSILKEGVNEDILKNAHIENEKGEEQNENESKNNSKAGASALFNEVELDQGLFGALTYLKTKGELSIEEKIYRNPENRPLHMPTEKDAIKLDYKNETGKVMTPKETFRHISWIFHGKKQGKKKLEKKIKRMEMERRFKENPIDSLPTLNVLKKYQETKKKPYFTLSNKM